MAVTWRLINDTNGVTYDVELQHVKVIDAFNRHARRAEAELLDRTGDLHTAFPELTPVRFQVEQEPNPYFTRFGGFVVNPERNRNKLIIDVLSHDYWLRKRDVFASYDASFISDILEDVITDLTPLEVVSSNITVTNDKQITRRWHGENLDVVLQELASIAGDHEYGANNDREFFFRPRNLTSAPSGFQEGSYAEADFDDDFKQEANRVRLFYGGDGNRSSLAVQDNARQLELQNRIGASRPVVVEATAHYPEIVEEDAAEDKARAILARKETVLKGEILTWGRYTTTPGDAANVVHPEEGVDGSFRVAQIEYEWPGLTRCRVAEDREDITGILIGLSDDVVRVDVRDADADAERLEILDLPLNVDVRQELLIEKLPLESGFFLFGNTGLGEGVGHLDVGGRLGYPYGDPVVLLDTETE